MLHIHNAKPRASRSALLLCRCTDDHHAECLRRLSLAAPLHDQRGHDVNHQPADTP
jgi:hypothetical protein